MKTQRTASHNTTRPFAMTVPGMKPVSAPLVRLLCAATFALLVFGAQAAVVFTTLYSFTGTNDGANPQAALVQGSDGYFYGATLRGGTTNENCYEGYAGYGYGTAFKISTNGALTTLHLFTGGDDGELPNGLVQGSDGELYGTTLDGWEWCGTGFGTVFRISTNGVLTTLHAFGTVTNPDGYFVDGNGPNGLVQGNDGSLYGTTQWGGAYGISYYGPPFGCGNVFAISTNGVLTSLYSFFTNPGDGNWPTAGLVQGRDGYLYGTTSRGGNDWWGNVFRISTDGALTSLYSFPGFPGAGVPNGVVQGRDGNFYGTTRGWAYGNTLGYPFRSPGTVFKVTTNGALTTLHSFLGGNDGENPQAALVQGSDGNFYGTTEANGMWFGFDVWGFVGAGTVFRISTNGTLTTLYVFGSITNASGEALDGANPRASLVQGSDGSFYGTTQRGGKYGAGTVFQLTILPEAPQLTITTWGTNVILTWPTNAAGFTLQSTANFGSAVAWTTNSPALFVVNGQNVVTIPITGSQQFFRLSQ